MSAYNPYRQDLDDYYDSVKEARFFKNNLHHQPLDGSVQIGATWNDAWKNLLDPVTDQVHCPNEPTGPEKG